MRDFAARTANKSVRTCHRRASCAVMMDRGTNSAPLRVYIMERLLAAELAHPGADLQGAAPRVPGPHGGCSAGEGSWPT